MRSCPNTLCSLIVPVSLLPRFWCISTVVLITRREACRLSGCPLPTVQAPRTEAVSSSSFSLQHLEQRPGEKRYLVNIIYVFSEAPILILCYIGSLSSMLPDPSVLFPEVELILLTFSDISTCPCASPDREHYEDPFCSQVYRQHFLAAHGACRCSVNICQMK